MYHSLNSRHDEWTLTLADKAFVQSTPNKHRLAVALGLLSYLYRGEFIPPSQLDGSIWEYVSGQLDIDFMDATVREVSVRTEERRRSNILIHLGITDPRESQLSKLKAFLMEEAIKERLDTESLRKAMLRWCVVHRVRPPTQTWIDRTFSTLERRIDSLLFEEIHDQLTEDIRKCLLRSIANRPKLEKGELSLTEMKAHPGRISKATFDIAVKRVAFVRVCAIDALDMSGKNQSWRQRVVRRVKATRPADMKVMSEVQQIGLYATYLYVMIPVLTDGVVNALFDAVNKFNGKAGRRVRAEVGRNSRAVKKREQMLHDLLQTAISDSSANLRDEVLRQMSEADVHAMIKAIQDAGGYEQNHLHELKRSWLGHYRPMLRTLLDVVDFCPMEPSHQYLIDALDWIAEHYFDRGSIRVCDMPVLFCKLSREKKAAMRSDDDGVDRHAFEVRAIVEVADALKLRKIWVRGSREHQDPKSDLPADFRARRKDYYAMLRQPTDPNAFVTKLRDEMRQELLLLNDTLPTNPSLNVGFEPKWRLSPYVPLAEPTNLVALKRQFINQFDNLPLVDVFKEAALDTGFLRSFVTALSRTSLSKAEETRLLLLTLYGLGTNVGLRAVAGATAGVSEDQLRNIKRSRIDVDNLTDANVMLSNSILRIRNRDIWGDLGTACASDSKQYAAWDQNPFAEMSLRHRSSGIMIYWHVERGSMCIYSSLKRVSASEVAAMLKGLLDHKLDDWEVTRNSVDTHGQTEVAFGFCHLLGFDLAPRIKRVAHARLALSDPGMKGRLGNMHPMCVAPIDWDLIVERYDDLIEYATALREKTVDATTLLRLFRRGNRQNPNYRAVAELGRAVKTIFLCRYLRSEELRREIQEGLNVVENWNGMTKFVHFGRGGTFSTNSTEEIELAMKSLQLVQNSMVYFNTRLYQSILSEPKWSAIMTPDDYRGLCPLISTHINLLGELNLDMGKRIKV